MEIKVFLLYFFHQKMRKWRKNRKKQYCGRDGLRTECEYLQRSDIDRERKVFILDETGRWRLSGHPTMFYTWAAWTQYQAHVEPNSIHKIYQYHIFKKLERLMGKKILSCLFVFKISFIIFDSLYTPTGTSF